MGLGLAEQIETHLKARKKNGQSKVSGRLYKRFKNRGERRRAKRDPETAAWYRRYAGWMY